MNISPTPLATLLTAASLASYGELLELWSRVTIEEPHMLSQTPAQLLESCWAAALLTEQTEIVGVAGLFEARTKANEAIVLDGRPLVELGAAYIVPSRRGHGLGGQLVRTRLDFAHAQGWPVVCITSNPVTQHLCTKFGARPLDDYPNLAWLREVLCLCPTRSSACKVCPHTPKAAWLWL